MHLGRTFAIAILAGSLASFAAAETPAGAYQIDVGGDAGLAFPFGEAELCEDTPDGEICVSSEVATDASGAVTGVALLTVDGPLDAEIALELAGQVSGSTLKPKTVLAFDAEGQLGDLTVEGSGKMRCGLHREVPAGQMLCKGRARLCAFVGGERLRCGGLPFMTVVQLVRVPFEIALDVETDEKNTVLGDATVAIDVEGAPPIAYAAKGKYKTSADTSNLKLASVDPSLKTSIALKQLELEAGDAVAGTVAFKIAGQKGQAELPTPTVSTGFCCDPSPGTSALNLLIGGFQVPHMPPSNGFIFYFY